MAVVMATPIPAPNTIGESDSMSPSARARRQVQITDEPEQCAGGEEVEDHARLEHGVMVVDPGERLGGSRMDGRVLGIDETGERRQHHERHAAQRTDALERTVTHSFPFRHEGRGSI